MGYIVDEMSQLFPIDNDQITDDQKLSLWKIMAKHSNAVSRGPHDIGHCTKAQLRINTGTAPPSRLPLRRFSPQQEKYIREETQRLLERDVIKPSTSPWSAQVVLASKNTSAYISILVGGHFLCDFVKALAAYVIGRSSPSCT